MKKHPDYTIVKTYSKDIDGLNFNIKARILKRKIPKRDPWDYLYEISHYYKPSEAVWSVYIPGDYTGRTLEEVESKLFFYLNPFTAIGVKPNDNW
jgi:hypothetical protein